MLRVWFRVMRHNKIVEETVTESALADEAAAMAQALQASCLAFDIARPLWLSLNERDIERYRRTTLTQDNFMEHIAFDKLEIEILEEDSDS